MRKLQRDEVTQQTNQSTTEFNQPFPISGYTTDLPTNNRNQSTFPNIRLHNRLTNQQQNSTNFSQHQVTQQTNQPTTEFNQPFPTSGYTTDLPTKNRSHSDIVTIEQQLDITSVIAG
ncbi:hypothetical protein RRG08_048152 [Elysia crispata]|uniref:Uncharacterized protein n=1 Tax=Elysia crispata TaxID=231223 RepID=A0AAE0ZIF7_9GAST|nr:hypothetical protein RRG08_048152 [Elysia crispata]